MNRSERCNTRIDQSFGALQKRLGILVAFVLKQNGSINEGTTGGEHRTGGLMDLERHSVNEYGIEVVSQLFQDDGKRKTGIPFVTSGLGF